MEPVTISARTLGELQLPTFCPKCYWIKLRLNNKVPFQIPMPGIFNSLDSYGKNLIHGFFDQNHTLPPWFPGLGNVTGYVEGRILHWSRFKWEDLTTRITLRGTPDDIFELADSSFHIVDYKTAKATATQDELFPLYEVQINVYAYIFDLTKLGSINNLSLIYMEPLTEIGSGELPSLMSNAAYSLKFKATQKHVPLRANELVPELLKRARQIIDEPKPRAGRRGCRDCELLEQLMKTAHPFSMKP
jgi:hypothetical protein